MATYVNNEFVGRGVMPSVAVGQRFSVGLGIDSSLRARGDLMEKTETMRGGNRVVDFTYRLTIENFGLVGGTKTLDRPGSEQLCYARWLTTVIGPIPTGKYRIRGDL